MIYHNKALADINEGGRESDLTQAQQVKSTPYESKSTADPSIRAFMRSFAMYMYLRRMLFSVQVAVDKIVVAVTEMAAKCVIGHPNGPGLTEDECRAWRTGAREVHASLQQFAEWMVARRPPGLPMFFRYDADMSGHIDMKELSAAVEHWQRDLIHGDQWGPVRPLIPVI